MAKIILFPGSSQQRELDLDGRERVALGRDGRNDLVLPRRMASRRHALIEHKDGRFFVRDTDSYNGTFVNEQPVREAQLLHGDEIRIAGCILRFEDPLDASDDPLQRDTLRLPTMPLEHEDLIEVSTADLHALGGPSGESHEPAGTTSDAAVLAVPGNPAGPAVSGPGMTAAAAAAAASSPAPMTAEAAPESAGAVRPRPVRPISMSLPAAPAASGSGVSLVRAVLIGLVASAIVLAAWLLLRPGADPQARAAADPTRAGSTEEAAYSAALRRQGEARLDGLWEFLRAHPQGQRREQAYLSLLDHGASPLVVCDHVRRNAIDLLQAGAPLAQRCGAP